MKVATGLASGQRPLAELAERAVRDALERADCQRAEQVILFLSKDFARQPQPALRAAARTAACLQIGGCTASGLMTERGWLIDQPAAAALVLADIPRHASGTDAPRLSFSGQGRLAHDWLTDHPRSGLVDSDGNAWQQARECPDLRSTTEFPGLQARLLLSRGLRKLGEQLVVDASAGHELRQIGKLNASDSLRRHLPAELRAHPPLHQLSLLREDSQPGIGILSINADGSLTLADTVQSGDRVQWAIRQPLSAEQETRQQMTAAVDATRPPLFALMFSCIGRGPLFYGYEDCDLLAFRASFPDIPLLGAYGTGQIVPGIGGNQLFQNAVLTLLYERSHVQSHP